MADISIDGAKLTGVLRLTWMYRPAGPRPGTQPDRRAHRYLDRPGLPRPRARARHRRGYRHPATADRPRRGRRPHLGSPRQPHRRTRPALPGRHPGLPSRQSRDWRAALAAGQHCLVPGVVSELRGPQALSGRRPDPVRRRQAPALGDRLLRAPLRPARRPPSARAQYCGHRPDHRNRLKDRHQPRSPRRTGVGYRCCMPGDAMRSANG